MKIVFAEGGEEGRSEGKENLKRREERQVIKERAWNAFATEQVN